jgi:hypothetical protein
MFGGVFVLGRIATSDVTASQTEAQVNPGVASPQTVFTPAFVRVRNLNLIQVRAGFRHAPSLPDPGGE